MNSDLVIGVLLALLCVVPCSVAPREWCVPGCKCTEDGLRQADCSAMNLLNVDAEFLGGELFVQALDLSHNSLSELPDDFPGRTRGRWRLLALNLASNAIASISSHALRGLSSLQTLDLSDNRLSSLPPGVLLDATDLQAIDLSGNKLKSEQGSGGWLLNAPRLTHLSLARCSLVHVSAVTFSRLSGLQTLDLSDNQLQALDVALVFKNLPGLRRLELADNPLACDSALSSWLTKHNIEQAIPICRDNSGPKRFESMRVEENLPAVFAGLKCTQQGSGENNDLSTHEGLDWEWGEEPEVTSTPMDHQKLTWRDMWGMPAFWAWLAGFLSGIMLCVWLVWCWHQLRNCCRRNSAPRGNLNRNESDAALLIGESSNSLLFEETSTIRTSYQPPGTPPPPYRNDWSQQ